MLINSNGQNVFPDASGVKVSSDVQTLLGADNVGDCLMCIDDLYVNKNSMANAKRLADGNLEFSPIYTNSWIATFNNKVNTSVTLSEEDLNNSPIIRIVMTYTSNYVGYANVSINGETYSNGSGLTGSGTVFDTGGKNFSYPLTIQISLRGANNDTTQFDLSVNGVSYYD